MVCCTHNFRHYKDGIFSTHVQDLENSFKQRQVCYLTFYNILSVQLQPFSAFSPPVTILQRIVTPLLKRPPSMITIYVHSSPNTNRWNPTTSFYFKINIEFEIWGNFLLFLDVLSKFTGYSTEKKIQSSVSGSKILIPEAIFNLCIISMIFFIFTPREVLLVVWKWTRSHDLS